MKPNDALIHQAYLDYPNDPFAFGRKVVELHQPLTTAQLEQVWKTKFEIQWGVSLTLFLLIAREILHPTIGGITNEHS